VMTTTTTTIKKGLPRYLLIHIRTVSTHNASQIYKFALTICRMTSVPRGPVALPALKAPCP